MRRVTSFFTSPLGILVIVLLLVWMYSQWRKGLLATHFLPAATKSPVLGVNPAAAPMASPGGIGNP